MIHKCKVIMVIIIFKNKNTVSRVGGIDLSLKSNRFSCKLRFRRSDVLTKATLSVILITYFISTVCLTQKEITSQTH